MAVLVGVDELLRGLAELERQAGRMRDANQESAAEILSSARPRVHSVTGALARSGVVRVNADTGSVEFGGGTIRWAVPVHEGSFDRPQGGFVAPNPYLEDARDAKEETVGQIYDDHLEMLIDQIGL